MAEAELVEEKTEFHQIMELIRADKNFLLSGGAGSGKTYSLVQVIKKVIEDNPLAKVACMTYTNAAVKEIEERVNHKNLSVTTIHDFLWDNIKYYKKELKQSLVELINDEEVNKIVVDGAPVLENFFDDIDAIAYREYLRVREGIISHDELLILAHYMFSKYPKLCGILKDRYRFIFIDEYQDTNSEVIKIFMNCLSISDKKCTVGFFGDAMQSIYDNSIGNLDEFKGIGETDIREVLKEQNRRNPRKVYELANQLRTDGIVQIHSNDITAPNMLPSGEVKEGNIKFIYSANATLGQVKDYLGWDFNNSKTAKELNLTHNLIAGKAGFKNLMDIYNSDRIIEYKNNIVSHLKNNPEILLSEDDTFGDVIDRINLAPTGTISNFISNYPNLYNEARQYNFTLFKSIYLKSDVLTDDKKQDPDDEAKKGSKRDNLLKHLFKIQDNIFLYRNGRFNEFIRKTQFKIRSINEKKVLEENIVGLIDVGDKTIEEVINEANEKGICLIDDKLTRFKTEKTYAYNRIKEIKFNEFQKLYDYLEGHTPFSTQHKVKGDEFDNVLVILDNGRWNNYNFQYLFLENGNPTVLSRTQKIFYVCCTRAKENLAVYYHNPTPQVIAKAKQWFGEENVVQI